MMESGNYFPPAELLARWREFFPMESFRQYQESTIEKLLKGWSSGKKYAIVEGPTGCHARGTKILMYDGTGKKVEDISVNDLLMGPDSQPRKVTCLHRGRQEMVKIIPTKGRPFIVNMDHILSLQRTPVTSKFAGKRKDFKGVLPIIDLTVREWLAASKTFKHTHKLYRKGITFPSTNSKLPIPPYILGLWLGDGTSECSALTTMDASIATEWGDYATLVGLEVKIKDKDNGENKSKTYRITSNLDGREQRKDNKLFCDLSDLGLINNKRTPHIYLTASEADRLELLAGLLDTDGSLQGNCFDFVQKRKVIAKDACFLARSLGLAAYLQTCSKKSQNGTEGKYYRVCISGDVHKIPTRLPHKKATIRKLDKSVLRTGFKAEILPEDDFFGFELTYADDDYWGFDDEHLYLLYDFTVCHNSGKSCLGITAGRLFGDAWYTTPEKMLQEQISRDFDDYIIELKGRSNYPCLRINFQPWVEKLRDGTEFARVPIEEVDYITEDVWNNLSTDHIFRKYNCANAPCCTLSAKKGDVVRKECRQAGICAYIRQRDLAMASPFALLNFSNLLLFTMLMPKPYKRRPLLIIDECHVLEGFLYDFATITVNTHTLKPLETYMPDSFYRITEPFDSVTEFISHIVQEIIPAFEKYQKSARAREERSDNKHEKAVAGEKDEYVGATENEYDRMVALKVKLKALVKSEPTDHSHVLIPDTIEEAEKGGTKTVRLGYKIKPFSVAKLNSLAFGSSDSKVLLMSATILDPSIFCKSLGIDPKDAFYIPVPSTFPAENRPLFSDLTIGSMSYKNIDATLPKMMEEILKLADKHRDQKGIIHTGNYVIMRKLERFIKQNDKALFQRMLFQSVGNFAEKSKILSLHELRKDEPTILCGPGFIKGLDLKDDLARFNILMKLPYMSLADPLIKRKAEEFPKWYSLQVALAIVQALGRSVRSKDDWSVLYILDALFKWFYGENKEMFPKYIRESIRWITKNGIKAEEV